jgi:hypothetical protein
MTMQLFEAGDLDPGATTHHVTTPSFCLLRKLFGSQEIDLTERVWKRQQAQTRLGGRSKSAPDYDERHRALTHNLNLAVCSSQLLLHG